MQKLKKFIIHNSLFIILLFLSFWAVRPLLRSGFFPIHDDTQVARVYQMAQALRDGQFPVRWVADLGYGFGYPIFNFYAPLAYYVGAFFNLIGFNALAATKLMFGLGILLAGVSMYLLAREFWGEAGGVVSGLFYVYAPYHAIQIYVRGAAGELWAMAFLPLVFLSFYKLFDLSRSESEPKQMRWIILGSLSLAAVILSHNLTAMMLAPIVIIILLYCYIAAKNKKLLITHYSLLITLALAFSAFYWLPALMEMNLTKVFSQIGGGADFRDHFVFLDQLWASPWGFGGSAPGRLDGMSFMVGKLHLLVALLTAVLAIFSLWTCGRLSNRKEKSTVSALLLSFCVFAAAVFFTNKISQPIWEAIPIMAFIQYPWRFLIFASLGASFLAGGVAVIPHSPAPSSLTRLGMRDLYRFRVKPGMTKGISGLRDSWVVFFGATIIVLALLFFNTKYFQPQFNNGLSNEEYTSEEKIKWETSKISGEYLPKDFPIPQTRNEAAWEKVVVLTGEVEIKNLILKSHHYSFKIEAGDKSEILINTAYFPGWKVWMDGKETDFTIENGKILLVLPPRGVPDGTPPREATSGASPWEYRISVRLKNTPVRAVSNLVSLVSFLGLVVLLSKLKLKVN